LRPTKYKPEYCEMLIEHMKQGMMFETFAPEIGVHRDTLYEWCKVHKEFSDAKKTAIDHNLLFYDKMAIAAMSGKIKNFNATTYIFNMKNRHHWRDRHEYYEAETKDDFALPPNLMPNE
jgi:hypothetical protein